MRTIIENFQIVIDRQNLLGYYFPKLLQAPADILSIHHAEESLNLKFNLELYELYEFANGTRVDEGSELTLRKIGLIPIHNFLSLEDAVSYYNSIINMNDDTLNDFFLNFDTDYKPGFKLFPFLEDNAGNCYWVDLNVGSKNYGKIFWTNTYGEQPDYAFESLTSMFQTIAECYESGIMTVDEEKNLSCDYNQWYRIAKKNNPGLTHWDIYLNQ
ncbi:MAG: SMI1/KNR4 family protein [Bacillota bacterium]|nr:SMI1/KNR4 family protein [Bacillota bacterium]